jgi:hypothetical protein
MPDEDDAADDAGSGWDEEMPETPMGSSSPGSTDRPRPVGALLDAGSREAYAQMVTIGASAVSGVVDLRAGGTGAFVMREDEAAEIAGPASRILARRFPMGGSGASEASDVFGLVMGVAGWIMGSMRRRAEAPPAGDESGSWAPMGDPAPAGGYEHGAFDVQEDTVAPPAPRPYFPGAAPLPRVNA